MTEQELKAAYAELGYELEKGIMSEGTYVVISRDGQVYPMENLSQAESAYNKLREPVKQAPKPVLCAPKEQITYYSLKDEVSSCLKDMGVEAIVAGARKGERHVKVYTDADLAGTVIDNTTHKIRFDYLYDMFGNKQLLAMRVK